MKVTLNVKALVDARGWDAGDLAAQADLPRATAEHLYAGHSTELDLAAEARVCQALGVLPQDILVSVEEPQPSVAVAPAPRGIATPSYQRPTGTAPESGVRDAPEAAPRDRTDWP